MGEDEEGTYQTLASNLQSIRSIVSEHNGRVFSSPGDAIMAQFVSVVDAVKCAVEIQDKIEAANAETSEDRKMQFRIGVNLGDVIEDGDRIYGDGVNIAARIETLAEPGKVAISKNVYRNIRNKLKFGYEYQGEHQVKNISEPVRVYKVLTTPEHAGQLIGEPKAPTRLSKQSYTAIFVALALVVAAAIWQFYFRAPKIEPASVEKMAYPLPEKPSIAVLPFANMSEDPKQEYLSDGITEQIITTLSKVPSMFVIARTSTFAYKNKPVKVQQVSEELGVRYVLEGSVQRSGDRLRITAQLIDAIDGRHMWAQRYDRELKDTFKLQDEITLKIINALRIKLQGEKFHIVVKNPPRSVEYMEKAFEAAHYTFQFTKEGNHRAKQICKELIDLEPDNWRGYALLASIHSTEIWNGWSSSIPVSMAKAVELSKKAISLDETQDFPHILIANIYLLMKKYDPAMEEAKRAIAKNPNSSGGYTILCRALVALGRPEEGIEYIKKGMRLDPFPNAINNGHLAVAYREAGRYEEAIAEYKKVFNLNPNALLGHIGLSMTFALAGRFEEARKAYSEALKIDPEYSLEKSLKIFPFKPERYKVIRTAFQKAGILGKPPLPLPDKPSIAVLAFDNISGDPEQEYFSDGISEDIITALSKTPKMLVIARNSTFTYKGTPVKVQEVGRDLGVHYVLEGSVRKVGEKVRVTAQLVDAKTGHHLWAEKYDRELKDIFAVQDEITMKIITAMRVKLTEGEQARIHAKGMKNLNAYLKSLEAIGYMRHVSREGNILAKQAAEEVIRLDPEAVRGYSLLATAHLYNVWLRLSKSPKESYKKAIELSQKAIELDSSLAEPHRVLAHTYVLMRRYDEAIAAAKKAVEMAPGSADPHATLGHVLLLSARTEEAITRLEKAMRVNPFPPSWYYHNMGAAYRIAGRQEEAITYYKKALEQEPNNQVALVGLITSYSLANRLEDAKSIVEELLKLNPDYCIKKGEVFGKDIEASKRHNNARRKAGLPDCPVR